MIPQQCTDDRYPDALACVRSARYISIPVIARSLQIGFNRAERLMQALIANGVVEEIDEPKGSYFLLKELVNNPCFGASMC